MKSKLMQAFGKFCLTSVLKWVSGTSQYVVRSDISEEFWAVRKEQISNTVNLLSNSSQRQNPTHGSP